MTRLFLILLALGALLGGCAFAGGEVSLMAGAVLGFLAIIAGSRADALDWRRVVVLAICALTLAAALAACAPPAQGAAPNRPLLRIEAAHRENCKIESRTYARPDVAISPRGAVGYCQVLPETAAWVVKYAVEWGLLDPWAMRFYQKPKAWEWLLQVRFVNEAISRAYMAWIYRERSIDLRVVLYKYHGGHNAPLRRGTESWRHSGEVYAVLFPWTVPPPAARGKHLTARN